MMATSGIKNANQPNLQLESTLQELPFWQVQIEVERPGNDLVTLFKQEPLLPGIILNNHQQYVGMISRRKFFEQMSHPYSLSLFSLRPIKILYKFFQREILILSEDMSIVKATEVTLQRPHQIAYEPILVKTASGKYRLVDFHQLLLAYSQIHVLTLVQLQQVEEQSRIAKAGFRDLQENYTRLIQNEKMAALGQLVAGIAHEINNPVNFIAGNLVHAIEYSENLLSLIRLYQQCYPEPEGEIKTAIAQIELDFLTRDLPNLLNSMKIGTKRIEEIILSLRNFSRLDESEKKLVDIHEGIESTLLILQSRLKNHQIAQNINLIKEYANLPLVECYPGLLNQVFMNILANAIDAVEEVIESGEWGKITNAQCPIPEIRIRTELIDDREVIIRIADNGSGIPESLQKRLFDPFFTTKPVGKGTGLGLSISYQIIVEKHRGQLQCISASGKGTEFIIKIPVELSSCV
ncbi:MULTISPECIES: sensor histidine kinase [Nostoc]|uniref:histidine kinase n=1 Tax=Nostoc paludosum FACHB-159 TaxID=2692908 RepID=A0ABR8KBG6_9NOSO|nr:MULTISPECIES: ATP-binding protein [Nostoc]MBD2680491.1 ATPase [Nostoc sp. FACHB-857]MBD2736881.1 ATPase [Nostoc paludosum FACHB-159]